MGLRLRRRPLRALQVEVTSRCSRRCEVCPRVPLADAWREGDLDLGLWARLVPDLGLAGHVHLQGWGEPLLHRDLRQMVRQAHRAGCTVGLTTNGDLLRAVAEWLVAERLDRLTVSVAGNACSHRRLRDSSSLDDLWTALRLVRELRGRRRRPRLLVSYLLTRQTAGDLQAVVSEAARAGADELFVVHLDLVLSEEQQRASLCTGAGIQDDVRRAVAQAKAAARKGGLRFRPPALEAHDLLVCALDPSRFAFVGWDGRVGPCVNLLLPVAGAIPRRGDRGTEEVEAVVWGDLRSGCLAEILRGERRREFVKPLLARLAAAERFAASTDGLWGSHGLDLLEAASQEQEMVLAENPLPQPCRGCAQAAGW